MEGLSHFELYTIIQVICTQYLKLMSLIYLSFLFIHDMLIDYLVDSTI